MHRHWFQIWRAGSLVGSPVGLAGLTAGGRSLPREALWGLALALGLLALAAAALLAARARIRRLAAANAALTKAEQKLRLAMSATQDGIWEWYPQTGAVVWSPEAYTMLGYAPDAFPMTLDRWRALLHPEDAPGIMDTIMAQLRAEPDAFAVEFRLQHRDGSWVWIYGRGCVAEVDADGAFVHVIGTHTDITARKEMEIALRESEARYRSLFQNNHAVMFLIDPDGGVIVDANPAAARYYGWSRAQLCRMRVDEINTLSPAEVQAEMDLARAEKRRHFLFRHRRADGSECDVEVYSGPITIGERHLLYSIVHDITERRQAERDLAAWQALMQYIIKYDPNAIAVLDRDLRHVFVSDRFLDDYGVADVDIIGRLHYDVLPDIPARWREVHRRALTGEVLRGEDEAFERQDGTVDWTRWECRPWYRDEYEGEIGGIVLYTEVITERKRMEMALRALNTELEQRVAARTAELEAANQELEAVNQELEAFAYSVSHDLRAPLRAMDGFSAALLTHHADRLDAQGRHYLDRIQAASQRMGRLINDLLDLSRVTRHAMAREWVDLSALARELIAELREGAPERAVDVRVTDGMIVEGDAHLLRIALQNLLDNAWKFTAHAPEPRIEVGAATQDGERVIFVRDNGVGFDMAYADKLFKPFQRLHAMDAFPGTGIGLVTVRRIVTRHGGRIWVTAAEGEGAAFSFTLGGRR